MEKVISDFRILLEGREEKLAKLSQKSLSTRREEDEIQEDFYNDSRRISYHDLRKSIKGNETLEAQFMELQNRIFNS